MPLLLYWLVLSLCPAKLLMAQPSSPNDICSFETLTKSCSFFEADGPEKIVLKDGSSVPNLVALNRQLGDASFLSAIQKKTAQNEKNKPEFLEAKQKLINLLKEIPDDKLHPLFKFYLVDNFIDFFEAVFAKDEDVNKRIEIPWPIDNPKGTKLVSKKEIPRETFGFDVDKNHNLMVLDKDGNLMIPSKK